MPSFHYLMLYDRNLARIGDRSAKAARHYCQLHGYRFTCHTELLDARLHPSWNKIVAVSQHLAESDWTFWCDADTLVCNPDYRLEQLAALIPDRVLAMSSDLCGLCAGVFLIRNCAWSRQFLDTLLFLGQRQPPTLPKCKHEQETMHLLAQSFPTVSDQIAGIPESVITNPRSPWSKECPFLMHYWADSRKHRQIIRCMREMQVNGWSRACRRLNKYT